MERPLITLTTDFGLRDHYVGAMKGVILSRCPIAQIVDISHEVPSFSIATGAYTLNHAAQYFPPGTVHVAVIDPGVGTARKPLVAAASGQLFVAPDNGVLSFILERDPSAVIRELTNESLFVRPVSATFHGRDVFAPAAAAFASGSVPAHDAGALIQKPTLLDNLEPRQAGKNSWEGSVLSVDWFGNVITNFDTARFRRFLDRPFLIRGQTARVDTFYKTFGDAPPGICFAYTGSSGFLELAINQGNAAGVLELSPGAPLRFEALNNDTIV